MAQTITVFFPDGTSQAFPRGIAVSEIAESKGRADGSVIGAKVDGNEIDLSRSLDSDTHLELIPVESEDGQEILRHSTSHVMAHAVRELFDGVKVAIGPAIENGFYYDFDYSGTFTPDDFEKIEARMEEIVGQDLPFERSELAKDEAARLFRERGETYKVELIEEIPEEKVSLYRQGDFIDLCRGPHVPSTGQIRAFKLTSVAGAYWRGDERNPMLQRIYGTAFASDARLKQYLKQLEEAKKRDHRRLGKELELFNIYEEAGAGLVVYHPRGAVLRRILEDFEIKEHLKRGYQMVKGPQILKLDLWEKSGHLDNYKDFMYFTEVEGQRYALKPMNCVAHILIYKSRIRSYRDLPLRLFELGTVNRHEKSGVLHGLPRVREFTQDDAHIFCLRDQLQDEIKGIIDFVIWTLELFGFSFELELSTRPEKWIGKEEDWDQATDALRDVLEKNKFSYKVNEGEGAFYGPKIDVKLRDVLDRQWQCATIQCDFALPERFDLAYVGPDGQRHRPVMLHRVVLGSMERFMAVLIEHYGGAFPSWLAPIQAIVVTISERNGSYGQEVYEKLLNAGVRVEKDLRNESLRFKIREAQLQKIPYMLVVGDKEADQKGVCPRTRGGKDLGLMAVGQFIELLESECPVRTGWEPMRDN